MVTATNILARLASAGYEAYMVGGCVRDLLVGLPCKDVDICTSATPDQVMAVFPGSGLVGASFGVVLVEFDGIVFDVATYRKDGDYTDHRRPDTVEFTTEVLEDLRRRDFTMNTMLIDRYGRLIDHLNGRFDIADGVISCAGSPVVRFNQDALRMLRAVRFACRLGFRIAPFTREAIRDQADDITRVSAERITKELEGILTSGHADVGVKLLMELKLMDHIIPEFLPMLGCKQNPKHHPEGDAYEHTLKVLEQLPKGCTITLALAALLHDIGKPGTYGEKDGQPTSYGHEELGAKMTHEILMRLKFPHEVVDMITGHVADHMRFRVAKEMKRSKLFRFIGQPHFDELLELHKIDARAGSGKLEKAEFVEKVMRETPEHILRPVRLATGRDLIEMGLTPGPVFRAALEGLQTEQLEGSVVDRVGALSFLKMFGASMGDIPGLTPPVPVPNLPETGGLQMLGALPETGFPFEVPDPGTLGLLTITRKPDAAMPGGEPPNDRV
jgi:poly(A) polymerase